MNRIPALFWFALILLSLSVGIVTAQNLDCPFIVQETLALSSRVCNEVTRNQACLAGGPLSLVNWTGEESGFRIPGEKIDAAQIQTLRLGGLDEARATWGLATMQIQANLDNLQTQRNVTLVLFGEAELENAVPAANEVRVTTTGSAIIRSRPNPEAAILERVALRIVLMANARLSDSSWLRVVVPDTGTMGWVSASIITAQGSISSLSVVEPGVPFYRPLQVLTLNTGAGDSPCAGAPDSGLIIQAPRIEMRSELIVNGVTLRLASTVFLQVADNFLIVNALEGQTEIQSGGLSQPVPPGSRVQIDLSGDVTPSHPEPYLLDDLLALPIGDLGRRLAIRSPLSPDEIEAALRGELPAELLDDSFPPDACTLTASNRMNVRGGPASFYEVIRELASGESVYPVFQTSEASGTIWWQLSTDGWVRADLVQQSGNCTDIPYTNFVSRPPSYNTLFLDGCTTSNGPIHDGQRVEMIFTVGSWPTYEEAVSARWADPGSIVVNTRRLYVRWTWPEKVQEERWYRRIRGYWIAEPGSYTITGERLHVYFSCDITVGFGN